MGRASQHLAIRGFGFHALACPKGEPRQLGETLGLDLELEAQERPVGPFRADILCKDIGTDRWVLIENQLERTDHTHVASENLKFVHIDGVVRQGSAAQ
jgi:hypothetical protein